jgi:hypothetical protein
MKLRDELHRNWREINWKFILEKTIKISLFWITYIAISLFSASIMPAMIIVIFGISAMILLVVLAMWAFTDLF